MLEQLYGRKAFDELINHHFKRYAFGTVTTDLFLADLKAFHEKNAQTLGVMSWANLEPLVAAWIDGGGLPAPGVGGFPELESKAFQRVEQQVSKFLVSGEPLHSGYCIHVRMDRPDGCRAMRWLVLTRVLVLSKLRMLKLLVIGLCWRFRVIIGLHIKPCMIFC